MEIENILEKLSNVSGVSGSEIKVAEIIEERFKKTCDMVKKDALGNIIALKSGNKNLNNKKIMIVAHMDEIGLMVKNIEKNGFLHFINVGGIDERTLLAQEVIVHGKNDIFGIIGAKPPHLQKKDEQNKSTRMEDLYIDIGLSEKDARKQISIGDFITINRSFTYLQGKSVTGKALDDRAGIVAIIQCIKELKYIKHNLDIYFVATVQEEVGLRGATTSSFNIIPDIGIAIDVGHGRTPDLSKEDTIELGKGPAIALGANIHPKIYKRLVDLAKEYNIPHQMEVNPSSSGTDAWAIQVTQSGVPTGLLSIPLRYMHTSVELVNINDIKHTGRLIALFIASINDTDLEEWLCF